jgi:hypothetical protein
MDFYCGGQTSFCESMVPYGLTQITNWAFAFCGWRLRGGGCVQKCKKEEPPEKNFVQEEGLSPFLLYTQKNDTDCGGGTAKQRPTHFKFHYYYEAFFPKVFFCSCCLSFPNTFLT